MHGSKRQVHAVYPSSLWTASLAPHRVRVAFPNYLSNLLSLAPLVSYSVSPLPTFRALTTIQNNLRIQNDSQGEYGQRYRGRSTGSPVQSGACHTGTGRHRTSGTFVKLSRGTIWMLA